MRNGYSCAPLHGGIDQFDRDSTITDFKNGTIKILVRFREVLRFLCTESHSPITCTQCIFVVQVATSVAARGLDVKNLILVVNYDCPNHYEDYVHRVRISLLFSSSLVLNKSHVSFCNFKVGRTGRAGHKGYAYTFILPERWF